MKIDALKQYAKLRQRLLEEKADLEASLNEINQVLGGETAPVQASQISSTQEAPPRPVARRGRRAGAGNTMSLSEAVLKVLSKRPLSRKELVNAVEEIGYVFTTKKPLNSIGPVLYAKNSPFKRKDGKFYLLEGVPGQAMERRRPGRPRKNAL